MHYFAYPAHNPHWSSPTLHAQVDPKPTAPKPAPKQPQIQFPPVDIEQLHSSAAKFQEIMKEASLLVDKIVNSPEFAYQLMNEAQQSNKEKVEALIISTGIQVKVHTKYSPTGIHIELDSSENAGGCCKLNMGLLW